MSEKLKGLSVTALYTCQTWLWGGFRCAPLFAHPDSRRVFNMTNAALGMARLFRPDYVPLRHSLVHRHAMIDALLREGPARQVLELAAGLSRRGAAFSEDAQVRYTELDLPHVIARKRSLLERTEEGRAVLARPNYRLVEADVEQAPLENWVEPGEPLWVIAEGLMMYLTAEAQARLWRRVKALCQRAGRGRFVFDLVPACEQPRPGRVGRGLGAAMRAFTGGRTFERDGRTREDIANELKAAGFSRVEQWEPPGAPPGWELPIRGARSQTLLFVSSWP